MTFGEINRQVMAYLLMGIGGLMLITVVFNPLTLIALLAMAPGLAFLYGATVAGGDAELAIPGMLVTGTGLILLFCFITGHWASWAYTWLLYPVFLGIAFRYVSENSDGGEQREMDMLGRAFMTFGSIGFVVWGLICELLFFKTLGSVGAVLVAVGMILAGYWLLRGDGLTLFPVKRNRKRKNEYHQAGIFDA